MDDIDWAGFCAYESIRGLDCTIQGFELLHFFCVIIRCHALLCSPVVGLHTVFTVVMVEIATETPLASKIPTNSG